MNALIVGSSGHLGSKLLDHFLYRCGCGDSPQAHHHHHNKIKSITLADIQSHPTAASATTASNEEDEEDDRASVDLPLVDVDVARRVGMNVMIPQLKVFDALDISDASSIDALLED